ncbi:hypothetical protein EIP86_003480 [Pleurotus ostreatoroseus]|nr:hypothetical protein EIP86_003480 [Pleurotus ostreatoroseus]
MALITTKDKKADQLKEHDKLPENLQDLSAWAHVQRFTATPTNPYLLVHSGEALNNAEQVHEVFFRVQGYVLEVNMEPLGDWDGELSGAPKARQFLTLHGGADNELFAVQCDALSLVREFILRRTRSTKVNTDQNGRIYMHNKVFSKVKVGFKQKSVLTDADDPFDRARHVAKHWLVTKKIVFGFQDAAGKLKAASYLAIRPGDFVDVKLHTDISTYREEDKTETRVYFSVDRVREVRKDKEPEVVEEEDLTFDDNEGGQPEFMSIN